MIAAADSLARSVIKTGFRGEARMPFYNKGFFLSQIKSTNCGVCQIKLATSAGPVRAHLDTTTGNAGFIRQSDGPHGLRRDQLHKLMNRALVLDSEFTSHGEGMP